MTKPLLHFSHANSFPAGTYRQFFDELRQYYRVAALDMHAHNPHYPVQDGWAALMDELIDELATRYTEPVILVGHSLGGMLSMMAGKQRPDLVRCVVLLDSPVLGGWRALFWRLLKNSAYAERHTPARFSARRRMLWPDVASVHDHYSTKSVFSAWAPGVLQDYLDSGLKPHPDGVQLRFTRDNESAVYRSLPHNLGTLAKSYPVPIGFVGGLDSVECRQAGLKATRKLVGPHFCQLPGGHLFPMESPAPAARATRDMIASLLAPKRSCDA